MKIAIHQPNFLPWIGYFDKMDQADIFVILDKANHSNSSNETNRNKIKTSKGSLWLTVPLTEKVIPINELRIDNSQNWKKKHWETIQNNYKKSIYWNKYKEGFEQIYNTHWEKLIDLNLALINHIKALLNLNTVIMLESDFQTNFGKGHTRILNIVKHLNGKVYLSGTGAKAYNNEKEFQENKIQLNYQDFKHPKYAQSWGDFIPNLSIIDMIFHCGPETIQMIRNQRC
ncbi:WbqC family protein [Cytobacillus dafuensis]|uniref:WbqC family protein n=1 Tax=Cytobacillus dafuensis TaxID=1742359 RepID=A0A5B8Z8D3_CYTDA|nr:WbqC family protein [Cytobacillus dafuensis]QED49208.1 WbqC family protein [Cytobacillus dafuensis]